MRWKRSSRTMYSYLGIKGMSQRAYMHAELPPARLLEKAPVMHFWLSFVMILHVVFGMKPALA